MGVVDDANPLHHDRFTAAEAVAAVGPHYTDEQALAAVESRLIRATLIGAAVAHCAGAIPDETTDVTRIDAGETGQDACVELGGGAVSGWGCDAVVLVKLEVANPDGPLKAEIVTGSGCLDLLSEESVTAGISYFGCCHRGDPTPK